MDRAARFRRRHGDLPPDGCDEIDNPLPGVLDPITLEQVQRPAMSPFSGHVMGLATWAAVLAGAPFEMNQVFSIFDRSSDKEFPVRRAGTWQTGLLCSYVRACPRE